MKSAHQNYETTRQKMINVKILTREKNTTNTFGSYQEESTTLRTGATYLTRNNNQQGGTW